MKIYTKTGDQGKTSLLGGTRVDKFHPRIEAYGTMDELNSYIGLIRDHDIDQHYKDVLLEIQDRLFTIESQVAKDPGVELKIPLPEIIPEDISMLEHEIDSMNEALPELKNFILPGGHPLVSFCHIARCVCRRAERHTLKLAKVQQVDKHILIYINRLSDYLFVLARKLAKDMSISETYWKART